MIAPVYAKTILIVGDSLSAAYGIDEKAGWVALLDNKMKKDYPQYRIVNLSISGSTTRNGLTNFSTKLAQYNPDIIVIELGANDGLRGLPIEEMQNNLEQMIIQSEKKSAKILLLATLLPPNYGANYLKQFNQVYLDLSQKYKVVLIPMFLDGVAGNPALMQSDGLHPNQNAQEKILSNIWPTLKTLL